MSDTQAVAHGWVSDVKMADFRTQGVYVSPLYIPAEEEAPYTRVAIQPCAEDEVCVVVKRSDAQHACGILRATFDRTDDRGRQMYSDPEQAAMLAIDDALEAATSPPNAVNELSNNPGTLPSSPPETET